jgi:hypothetical protein
MIMHGWRPTYEAFDPPMKIEFERFGYWQVEKNVQVLNPEFEAWSNFICRI